MTTEDKTTLIGLLNKQWANDASMVKECLKSTYIKLGDKLVAVASKPHIETTIYYDDETDRPEVDFDYFVEYNLRNALRLWELETSSSNGAARLYIAPNYYHDQTDGKLCGLRYMHDFEDTEAMELVTTEQLYLINQAEAKVLEDYKKRLATYWKRYSDKVRTHGYWANR